MVGTLSEKQNRRWILWYGLATTILFCAISLLQRIDSGSIHIYYYLAQGLALLLGMVHLRLIYKFLLTSNRDSFWIGFFASLLLMLAGTIGATLVYYYLKMNYTFLTFILPFIIPYICWKTYLYFLRIPRALYKIWYYPINAEMPDLDMIDLSQIEVVQFVFNKKPQDPTQTNFTSKAPLNMTLGQLFFIFINDYNEKNSQNTIGYLNDQNLPHGWFFYRKRRWFGKKHYFDPDLSFRDNIIQPNEFIYAYRIIEG